MLFCLELTEETIRNFFSESKMLCGLRHPNIIHVTGVCVVPPSICMVMELCKGSLRELLELPSSSDLAWGDRLSMATDCARAVACLCGAYCCCVSPCCPMRTCIRIDLRTDGGTKRLMRVCRVFR
eukprot:m.877724 g.877724  ORF g.877724 m.877724 type:complete len:125 (+) comp23583_c0_seq4:364-738(+)